MTEKPPKAADIYSNSEFPSLADVFNLNHNLLSIKEEHALGLTMTAWREVQRRHEEYERDEGVPLEYSSEEVELQAQADAALEVFLSHNYRLILNFIQRYHQFPQDELFQIGVIALQRAAQLYNPEIHKNHPTSPREHVGFGTYATLWIRAEVGRLVKHRPADDVDSIDEELSLDPDGDLTLLDTIPDPSELPEELARRAVIREYFSKILNRLKLRDRRVILMRFYGKDIPEEKFLKEITAEDLSDPGEPFTLKECAEILLLSRERVRQIADAAIKTFHRKVRQDGYKIMRDDLQGY
jgi:RNA polymerase sigma factor (sigma-70 family)